MAIVVEWHTSITPFLHMQGLYAGRYMRPLARSSTKHDPNNTHSHCKATFLLPNEGS